MNKQKESTQAAELVCRFISAAEAHHESPMDVYIARHYNMVKKQIMDYFSDTEQQPTESTDAPLNSVLTWRPIDDRCNYRPDGESTILIYDHDLDDVVLGYLDDEIWYDQTTGDPLPDPRFWTDLPYPFPAP